MRDEKRKAESEMLKQVPHDKECNHPAFLRRKAPVKRISPFRTSSFILHPLKAVPARCGLARQIDQLVYEIYGLMGEETR